MKHISLDFHFVREMVDAGMLKVCHVHTKDQWADVLTKPLSRQSFLHIRSKLGVNVGSFILRGTDPNNSAYPVTYQVNYDKDQITELPDMHY